MSAWPTEVGDEHSDRTTARRFRDAGIESGEQSLENLLEQASKKEPSYADFLDELLSCEVEARRTRYLRARLQLAISLVKTFEQFDSVFSHRWMIGRFGSCVPAIHS